MSVQAISWALSVKTGDPSTKVVLVAIANYADDKGRCWPSQSTIADQTEQSIDTIQRRIKDLESLGFVKRCERPFQKGKKGGLYIYHLLMPGLSNPLDLETMPQIAALSETTPQTCQNHTANDPKTTPHSCGTNHYSITTKDSTEAKNLNGIEGKSKPYRAAPGSPEFLAWKAYYTENRQRGYLAELKQRELEGRPFLFAFRWPPNYDEAAA